LSSNPFPRASPALAGGVVLYGVLALAFLMYQPGLSGTFLFDDYPNLVTLERIKSNPTVDEVAQFLLHGISSPSGRPVSLASFAAQAHDWPQNPEGFLYVNVMLHLLNGALLCWWLVRLTRLLQLPAGTAAFLPLATTTLWLLAPIQATAVLYIVQRMTELSATFVFLGMLLYVAGRQAGSLVGMSLALLVGCGIGTLTKENAVLMPLLVLVLECTLLARFPRPAHWRAWSALFLVLPLVALGVYVLVGSTLDAYASREFSLPQRLMTEARALLMYLHKLLVPWPSGIRLLYDDYPISTGLMQPWTTSVSILGVAGLVGAGWAARRRFPLFAFGALWFFAAHVLESSVIPLELVFEHRNYQASVGILFALAGGAALLWTRASGHHVRAMLAALAIVYVALVSLVTWQISTLWGQPLHLVAWWSEKLPDSTRAKIDYIGGLMLYGHESKAVEEAELASARWPEDPSFHLIILQYACQRQDILSPRTDEIASRVRTVRREVYTVISLIDGVVTLMEKGHCPHIQPGEVRRIAQAAMANPAMQIQRQNLLLLYSRALKQDHRAAEARASFREATEVKPVMILLIQGVLDELDAGDLDQARSYLSRAESDPRVGFIDRWSHRHDVEALRELLKLHEAEQRMP